jgi:hypothetical protein
MIRALRYIHSAETLLSMAGESAYGEYRTVERMIPIKHWTVQLRNQRALNPQALDLPLGCSLNDYVAFLDKRAYFWPGTADGPTPEGMRFLIGHAMPTEVVIRVDSKSLIEANDYAMIQVATCNTGAAWMNETGKSKRNFDLSNPLSAYQGNPNAIIEVSFWHGAALPAPTEYSSEGLRGWTRMF